MKTQKDIEIFEQFERLRFEVMDQDHFNLFKEKIKPYLGSLSEDEAINKYIQFNKHNRLFLGKAHILLYFSGDYNGSKTIILMDGYEIVHKDKTFTIEG